MKFHHQGYVSGDPRIQPAAGVGIDRPADLPEQVDVLIVGAGPAGMLAAAQLAQFPDINTRIVDRRSGRLEVGQADGIQPRSVETFQAFGFADRIVAEGCLIVETAFWKPDPQAPARIVRTSRVLEDPNGVSEFPHITVNQARVLDYFAEAMANAPTRTRDSVPIRLLANAETPADVALALLVGKVAAVRVSQRERIAKNARERKREKGLPVAETEEDKKIPDDELLLALATLVEDTPDGVRGPEWYRGLLLAFEELGGKMDMTKDGFYARVAKLVEGGKVKTAQAKMPTKLYGRDVLMNVTLYTLPPEEAPTKEGGAS